MSWFSCEWIISEDLPESTSLCCFSPKKFTLSTLAAFMPSNQENNFIRQRTKETSAILLFSTHCDHVNSRFAATFRRISLNLKNLPPTPLSSSPAEIHRRKAASGTLQARPPIPGKFPVDTAAARHTPTAGESPHCSG